MNKQLIVPLAIVIGGCIVAIAVYVSMPKSSPGSGNNAALVRPVSASDHILGNPAARVVIIEYSDFNCEYCKSFHDTLHQVIASEGVDGSVAWVFRHYPLTEIHPDAPALAKAAECAGEVAGQEGFWRFADALFKNQQVALSSLGTVAASVNIPGEAFATCYASESASAPLVERVRADRENARAMGARGTPFSILLTNGADPVVISGAYPYDMVRELIDEALAK